MLEAAMKKRMVLICIALMSLDPSVQAETQYSKLSPVWEKTLIQGGEGEWCIKYREGYEYAGTISAIGNDGRLFVCDPYNDRLLVFSDEGEKKEIINLKNILRFPASIYVDEQNRLYISDLYGEDYVLAFYEDTKWNIVSLNEKAIDVLEKIPIDFDRTFLEVYPIGCDNRKIVCTRIDNNQNARIIFDNDWKLIGYAPSSCQDKLGRYYDYNQINRVLKIYNSSGDITATENEYKEPPMHIIRYNGYVYLLFQECLCLQRFSESGVLEERIKISENILNRWYGIRTSPCAEYFFTTEEEDKDGFMSITVKKWKYEPVTVDERK
jgi:hypothetical protein